MTNQSRTDLGSFDDALRIHAICADEDLPEGHDKLLTYIHVKASNSPRGLRYFDDPAPEDELALRTMLGELPQATDKQDDSQDVARRAGRYLERVHEQIRRLDVCAHKLCGHENYFSRELRQRLRLYLDREFRSLMIGVYRKHIAGRLGAYSSERVRHAFRRHRVRKARQDRALYRSIGLR